MLQYLSRDVLDTQMVGGADARAAALSRDVRVVESGFGARVTVPVSTFPIVRRSVRWEAYTAAEETELREFLDRRKGRRVPFWLAPMAQDVAVSTSIKFSDGGFTMYSIDYPALYALGKHRRHWYIGRPGFYVDTLETTVPPVDNGNGTEFVTLGLATTGFPMIIGFLLYGRLDTDVVRIERVASRVVACSFDFVELPLECP